MCRQCGHGSEYMMCRRCGQVSEYELCDDCLDLLNECIDFILALKEIWADGQGAGIKCRGALGSESESGRKES
jgi:hypothetical protein